MLQKLANNLHFFIFAYTCFVSYEMYTKHEEDKKQYEVSLAKEKKKLAKKKKELLVVKKFEGQKEEAQAQFAEVEAEFEVIRKRLPSKLNNIENKSLFIKIANKLNINAPALEDRLKEEEKGFYFLKKYKLKGEGTFLQFLILLERVSESERLFNINSLKFYSKNDDQRGRFKLINSEIIIEAYRYNEDYKSPAERKALEAKNNSKGKKKPKKKRRRRKK